MAKTTFVRHLVFSIKMDILVFIWPKYNKLRNLFGLESKVLDYIPKL